MPASAPSPVTGYQIAAARVLAGLDRAAVATEAGVPIERLRQIETYAGPPPCDPAVIAALRKTLTRLGVQFLPEGRWGVGVRLKFNHQQAGQIARWEDEGGAAADDDVP